MIYLQLSYDFVFFGMLTKDLKFNCNKKAYFTGKKLNAVSFRLKLYQPGNFDSIIYFTIFLKL